MQRNKSHNDACSYEGDQKGVKNVSQKKFSSNPDIANDSMKKSNEAEISDKIVPSSFISAADNPFSIANSYV